MISPECLVSMLFMSIMESNEAIVIKGAEQFSKYTGYDRGFRYAGNYECPLPR